MTNPVTPERESSLRTRPSLLKRLQSGDDQGSWEEFYRIYGGLIRHFALKSGLKPDESEEILQETAIGMARKLTEYVYDPKVCGFKSYLLNLTRWRIQHQLRKRRHANIPDPGYLPGARRNRAAPKNETKSTATGHPVPDPSIPEFGAERDAASTAAFRLIVCYRAEWNSV